VLYRFALEAARALAAAGATECIASLQRRDDTLVPDGVRHDLRERKRALSTGPARRKHARARGVGWLRGREPARRRVVVSAELPAPPVAEMPESWSYTPEEEQEIAELEREAAALDLEETEAPAPADAEPAPAVMPTTSMSKPRRATPRIPMHRARSRPAIRAWLAGASTCAS
jgi:hypothetical protein